MTKDRIHGRRSGVKDATDDGRAAFAKGSDRDAVPSGYQATKGLAAAFIEGWDAAAAEKAAEAKAAREIAVTFQEPNITTPEGGGNFYQTHGSGVTGRPGACPVCGRDKLADGISQAVVVSHRGPGVDHCRCRGCGSKRLVRGRDGVLREGG